MFQLDASILTKIAPSIKGQFAINVSSLFNEVCPMYGIDTADIFHEFIANVLHESQDCTRLKENLNYSVNGLMKTWPGRFPSTEYTLQFAHKPEKIANKVYGGRLGNIHPGDGWLFIGSGLMQITGREMTTLFTVFYNRKFLTRHKVEDMVKLLRTDLRIAMHSACWIFAVVKKLIPLAISDNFREIVKKINGGYIGMEGRVIILDLARLHIRDKAA